MESSINLYHNSYCNCLHQVLERVVSSNVRWGCLYIKKEHRLVSIVPYLQRLLLCIETLAL